MNPFRFRHCKNTFKEIDLKLITTPLIIKSMNMKKIICAILLMAFAGSQVNGHGHVAGYTDPLKKTFIENPKQLPDLTYQNSLRSAGYWQEFVAGNGHWNVIFDESSGMPQRAFGKPVSVGGSDIRSTALNFLNSNLSGFMIPMSTLEFRSEVSGGKYHYANWKQQYQGLEVLYTNVQVKMTHDYRVMQFALECHRNISVDVNPALSPQAAGAAASNQVQGITGISVHPELKILPVPKFRKYDFRLVYEIHVSAMNAENIPARYYTLIDAHSGEVLYRANEIMHMAANTDINVTGSLYLTHPYNPVTTEPLKNMKIVESGTTYFTDNAGFLNLSNTSNTTATFSLEGRWVRVRSNNVTPSWSVNLTPGANNISIDASTNIRQRSTYNSINEVHEFMKSKFPAFTGLDYPLPANVDVSGTCNAFYDGSSVNFYSAGGGCNATSLVSDVCYHEYGHGINDKFYQSIGFNFQNGAMNEGYADIWALGITGSPILGIGFFDNDPAGFVRRYDVNKKVYPQDLVGQVHADGEIIAGCFWDTYLNLGNLNQMTDLFKETFYAGITGPDGTEGTLYRNVLIETLTVDDNDGDITNGTPNFCDITSGFAIHGINLSAAISLTHVEAIQAAEQTPVSVTATATGVGTTTAVNVFYRVGNTGAFTSVSMSNTGGNNFEALLPAQPKGTIIEYYLAMEDNCGTLTNITPSKANETNPNIPYYIMVGFDLLLHEDFDAFAGAWQTGQPGDNATTGEWIIDVPVPSYVGNALVQPDVQNTPAGLFCAVTGNASSPSAGAGENDVDGGKTTLMSPEYDLSTYTNPAFSYHRWYSNDQGATPGTDFWQVAISGDGVNFVPVENTNVADHSWRRFAFKVLDYIQPTSTVTIRFIAEDAAAGSLIEAALDDLKLWDELPTSLNDVSAIATMTLFPNPTAGSFNINIGLVKSEKVNVAVINSLGQTVHEYEQEMPAGNNLLTLESEHFTNGIYQVQVKSGNALISRKLSILKD